MSRIIVITGNGKGKTTSALGMVLRAIGHKMKTSIIQFIKNRSDIGEFIAIKNFTNVEIIQCGKGFIPPEESNQFKIHCASAKTALELASEKLADTSIDMVVLDEICSTVHHNLLSENELISAVKKAHDNLIVICTGRYAPQSLIDLADTVSVVDSVKHGYETGIKAQKGVEF